MVRKGFAERQPARLLGDVYLLHAAPRLSKTTTRRPVRAQEMDWRAKDQERARQSVQAGRIRPGGKWRSRADVHVGHRTAEWSGEQSEQPSVPIGT